MVLALMYLQDEAEEIFLLHALITRNEIQYLFILFNAMWIWFIIIDKLGVIF